MNTDAPAESRIFTLLRESVALTTRTDADATMEFQSVYGLSNF